MRKSKFTEEQIIMQVHRRNGEILSRVPRDHAVRFSIGQTLKAGNDRNAFSLTDGTGQGAFAQELKVDDIGSWRSRGIHRNTGVLTAVVGGILRRAFPRRRVVAGH